MSTRGTIAVQLTDGTVSQVYSHYDNYLDGTGQMLLCCYNSQELAESLVKEGDISSVGKSMEHTVYYGRDRGEKGCDPYVFSSLERYYEGLCGQAYNYLYTDGQWKVEYHATYGKFINLADKLKLT
jgi:hypothetical protein